MKDLSLIKRIQTSETTNLNLEINFFNLFNRANFAAPVSTLSSPLFGRVTATRTGTNPRRTMVNMLNQDIVAQGNSELIWDYKGDRSLWEKIAPFSYTAPGLGWALGNHQASLGLLALWLIAVLVVTPLVVARVKID